ncbi:uncharacterized protein LOC131598257 [Vicia villosa]|uniref:uncharacterized protein LOC131598257 n=1 Tax=Vicia villosa TaxID=3911 RepID=UPI00273CA084|nr:uncharacterized protein LOC131598257 [Vicia villosa]
MLVLVNKSPTKEFMVERGLRKGDPLSPFLSVLVAEGLRSLVSKSVSNGNFVGFAINRNCFIDILQFSDDTLLVDDGCWKHLWSIKAVLRGFELENPEFTFLGIPIGSSPRRISMWKGLLDNEKNRLERWRAPAIFVKNFNKIQSDFLWGGLEERRHIHWVRWEEVCLLKEKGGLGIKRIDDFNVALLQKWRWRILEENDALWYKVLKARYGDVNFNMVNSCSNGYNTSFWYCKWLGDFCLKDRFPSLFSIFDLKYATIACMGGWLNGSWQWGNLGLPVLSHQHAGDTPQQAGMLLPQQPTTSQQQQQYCDLLQSQPIK